MTCADEEFKRSWKNRLRHDQDLKTFKKQGNSKLLVRLGSGPDPLMRQLHSCTVCPPSGSGTKEAVAGFEKLDDYLRGRSSVTAIKARAAREALKQSEAVQEAKKKWAVSGLDYGQSRSQSASLSVHTECASLVHCAEHCQYVLVVS